MITGSDAFYVVGTRLKDTVLAQFDLASRPRPGRAYVTTGQVAWDVCDCDGQLAVTIITTWLASSFPGQPGQLQQLPPCEVPYRVGQLDVHITRCAANPDDSGLPLAGDLDRSGREIVQDAWAGQTGVGKALDAMQDANDILEFIVGAQQMAGPQGGCVGSTQVVLVGLHNGCD